MRRRQRPPTLRDRPAGAGAGTGGGGRMTPAPPSSHPRRPPPTMPDEPRGNRPSSPGDEPHDELEPVALPITDVLDLHSFAPKEIADVVRDYLDAAYDEGYREVRLIHGKGIGVQRRTVRAILERDPRVVRFGDADGHGGGWGATRVELA